MNPTHPTQPALVFTHVFLDGADAWSAIRAMRRVGVPEATQERLMGGNARRMPSHPRGRSTS